MHNKLNALQKQIEFHLQNECFTGEGYSDQPQQKLLPGSHTDAPGSCHTVKAGERAILARLRTMTDAEFEALPYGSEGLWRKLCQ